MLKTIIVEDEERSRSVLQKLLERHCPDVKIVATAETVDGGRAAIRRHRPDLVFLDVEMPPSTGFDLLKAVGEVEFHVVFVTAYDHYAIKAIKFSALDYLLKPVDAADLRAAVEKAKVSRAGRRDPRQFEVLYEGLGAPGARIGLPSREGFVFARTSDIVRCEADSNYTNIFLRDGTKTVAAKTLGDVGRLLEDAGFVRIHQSHLVNLAHIHQYIRGDGGEVVLTDGTRVEVSRRHKQDLLGKLTRL